MGIAIERLSVPPHTHEVDALPTLEELNQEFVDVRNTGDTSIPLSHLVLSRRHLDTYEEVMRFKGGQLDPGKSVRVHTGIPLTPDQRGSGDLSHFYCGRNSFTWNQPGPGLVRIHVQPNWDEDEVRYETPPHEWANLRRGAGLTAHRPPC
jgi:hypothetical protein